MWKKILAGVALAVALFLGFVALRPGHYRVERNVAVSATAADVYAIVSDLRRWDEWSPWSKLDPAMKKELVSKLSLMKSKVALDYLMEILNK